MGGQDAFISNDMVTKKLGARFNYFSFHEFLDMMHVNEHGKNHTLPGRQVYNLTDKDMEEVKAWSKELADGSVENDVQEHYIENSVKAAVLIQNYVSISDAMRLQQYVRMDVQQEE